MHLAIESGHLSLVKYLMHACITTCDYYSSVYLAARAGPHEIIQCFKGVVALMTLSSTLLAIVAVFHHVSTSKAISHYSLPV